MNSFTHAPRRRVTAPLSAINKNDPWNFQEEQLVRDYLDLGSNREIGEALARELGRTPQGIATRAAFLRARRKARVLN